MQYSAINSVHRGLQTIQLSLFTQSVCSHTHIFGIHYPGQGCVAYLYTGFTCMDILNALGGRPPLISGDGVIVKHQLHKKTDS